MPSAKPPYDRNASWKNRKYTTKEWDALQVCVQQELRPFYPDKSAVADTPFGHPSDEWANVLLSTAKSAVSQMLWQRLRLTTEELKAEQRDLLKTLNEAVRKLDSLSLDFKTLLDRNADPRGCMDKINELLPHVKVAEQRIRELPPAARRIVAEHDAAVEMAIRVLRFVKETGVPIAATGDPGLVEFSPAVKILKIIGDALGLQFAEITWRDTIIEAKRVAPDLQ